MRKAEADEISGRFIGKFLGRVGTIRKGDGNLVSLNAVFASWDMVRGFVRGGHRCGPRTRFLYVEWVPIGESTGAELKVPAGGSLKFPSIYKGLKVYYGRGQEVVAGG